MSPEAFAELFRSAAASGAVKALSGLLPERISAAAAYRLYGRSNVERWQQEGLLQARPVKGSPSRTMLDRRQLEKVAARSNRPTYLPVAER